MAQNESDIGSNTQGLLAFCVDDGVTVEKAIEADINIKMITDLAPTIIWTRDHTGKLAYLNSFWYEFTGCPVSLDDTAIMKSYIHPDDLDELTEKIRISIRDCSEYDTECRILRADGEYRWFRLQSRVVCDNHGDIHQWLGVGSIIHELKIAKQEAIEATARAELMIVERTKELEDSQKHLLEEIDARQKSQDALRQAQKMESVGQLTGGIAHDFNNMLTVIIGNLELTKLTLANNSESAASARMDRQVTMAIEAALKAEKLTGQLLAFSRKSRLHPERLDVNEVVLGVQDMIVRAVGVAVSVEVDLVDKAWLCLSDKNQLESAILNLCINARDAMPEGGHIVIKTRNRKVDGASDTRFVSVSITDTGQGMSQETQEKAFEPFFTTKDVGKGSGLGLSMVYGFCQQSNGRVFIDSTLGKGTTIEMLFPYTAGETTRETNAEEDFHFDGNKASILVVDDEPGVRELAAAALQDMGYNVLSAEDGNRAIDVLRSDVPIDLLFTDIVMPNGLDGFELAKIANEIRPDMPIVFTTGHAEIALKELKKDLSKKIKVLGKPYRINDLNNMISTVLGDKDN